MLTLLPHIADVPQCQFASLEALLTAPFPQTPEAMLQLEQHLSVAAAKLADQIRVWLFRNDAELNKINILQRNMLEKRPLRG